MSVALDYSEIQKQPKGVQVEGYALLQSYSIKPTSKGGSYISGILQCKGSLPFKIWSTGNSAAVYAKMEKDQSMSGKAVKVIGRTDDYGGSISLIVEDMVEVDTDAIGVSKADFYVEVYNADDYVRTLRALLHKYCSVEACKVFETVFNPVEERFAEEFAAIYHHDNVRGGLIAHTVKVTRIATILKMYPDIYKHVTPDVLFVGAALHDVGKILEYNDGSISKDGKKLSHTALGLFILYQHKDEIVKLKGGAYFEDLAAIISEHHGEYGERPRTVAAYVVHLCDALEADLTGLDEAIKNSPSDQFRWNDYKLS